MFLASVIAWIGTPCNSPVKATQGSMPRINAGGCWTTWSDAPGFNVRRATLCSSHSSGGLSAVKGMGVAVLPFGIRSNKLVGLGKLKSLPYRKIFIILMCVAYDSKTTFIKPSEPYFKSEIFAFSSATLWNKVDIAFMICIFHTICSMKSLCS